MAQLSTLIIAGAALLGAVQAAQLHVNKGCIVLNAEQQLCSGSSTTLEGKNGIYACFEDPDTGSPLNAKSDCNMLVDIPKGWGDIYYGEDNCLYTAGSNPTQLQCAEHVG